MGFMRTFHRIQNATAYFGLCLYAENSGNEIWLYSTENYSVADRIALESLSILLTCRDVVREWAMWALAHPE